MNFNLAFFYILEFNYFIDIIIVLDLDTKLFSFNIYIPPHIYSIIRIYTNIGNNVNFYYYLCWSTLLPISIIR